MICGGSPRTPSGQRRKRTQSSYPSRRIVVRAPDWPATPPTTPTLVIRVELFLGFSSLRTAGHFALGHVAGKTTDVIL